MKTKLLALLGMTSLAACSAISGESTSREIYSPDDPAQFDARMFNKDALEKYELEARAYIIGHSLGAYLMGKTVPPAVDGSGFLFKPGESAPSADTPYEWTKVMYATSGGKDGKGGGFDDVGSPGGGYGDEDFDGAGDEDFGNNYSDNKGGDDVGSGGDGSSGLGDDKDNDWDDDGQKNGDDANDDGDAAPDATDKDDDNDGLDDKHDIDDDNDGTVDQDDPDDDEYDGNATDDAGKDDYEGPGHDDGNHDDCLHPDPTDDDGDGLPICDDTVGMNEPCESAADDDDGLDSPGDDVGDDTDPSDPGYPGNDDGDGVSPPDGGDDGDPWIDDDCRAFLGPARDNASDKAKQIVKDKVLGPEFDGPERATYEHEFTEGLIEALSAETRKVRDEAIADGLCEHSPIVLDLDGDGVQASTAAEGVRFDIKGTGEALSVAWPRGGDALLALDRDGDGLIGAGTELFGNGEDAANGFESLASLDRTENGGNNDGVLSMTDATFGQLRLWRDTNRDGVSQASELSTLTSERIVQLGLGYSESSAKDVSGNSLRQMGSFVRLGEGGLRSVGTMVDVWLKYRK